MLATDPTTHESILILPPPHSREQNNLTNAWDLRYYELDPNYDPKDPLKTSYTEDQWETLRLRQPELPQFDDLPVTFPGLRFVVGACGTKFGKTYGCAIRLVKEAWETPSIEHRVWWVAPTYDQAENAMLFVMSLLPNGSYRPQVAKHRLVLLNPDGSDRCLIEFKSGDKPESLRGYAVRFFVMDEVAQGMPEASYTSIMTTTTQTEGRGIFISTPNGAGWFYVIYQKGVKYYEDGTPKFGVDNIDPHPEWFSVRMPTHANPHVKLSEIELKRRQLTDAEFKQEFLAFFIKDANAAFSLEVIKRALRGTLEMPQVGILYVLAADLAKHKDYTVLTVMRRDTRQVVYVERFNKISWDWQKQRIIQVAKRYNNAVISMDSTGVGDAIYDDLVASHLQIAPYQIGGNEKKRHLAETLIVAMENGRIGIPPAVRDIKMRETVRDNNGVTTVVVHDISQEQLRALNAMRQELEDFERRMSPTGKVLYEAPKGQHDDCVISLALAVLIADQAPFKYKHKQLRGI